MTARTPAMRAFAFIVVLCLRAPQSLAAAFAPLSRRCDSGAANVVQQQPRMWVANPPSLLTNEIVSSPVGDEFDAEDCSFPTSSSQLSSPALVLGSPLDEASKRRNKALVHSLKTLLFDGIYGSQAGTVQRSYARFYALETIARMPYFGYVSVLHLLETLGVWRRAEYLKLHFAESWNELHHLLILEELMHGPKWHDRFVAQHIAVAYYWIVVGLYLCNPTVAYNLNQAVEEEAYETYDAFLNREREYLQSQPAPTVAKEYYTGRDLYLFDAMHHELQDGTGTESETTELRHRRPSCETLYDTFVNIRDDELEHVKTMAYLQGDCQDGGGVDEQRLS